MLDMSLYLLYFLDGKESRYTHSKTLLPAGSKHYIPPYTKLHVDKETGPDFCVTAIGSKPNISLFMVINLNRRKYSLYKMYRHSKYFLVILIF